MTKTHSKAISKGDILKKHIKQRLKEFINKERLEKFTDAEIVNDLINQVTQAKKEKFYLRHLITEEMKYKGTNIDLNLDQSSDMQTFTADEIETTINKIIKYENTDTSPNQCSNTQVFNIDLDEEKPATLCKFKVEDIINKVIDKSHFDQKGSIDL